MIERDFLIKKLEEFGFRDSVKIFNDVTQIILSKALANYLQKLPEDIRKQLSNFSQEELAKYIENNGSNLPQFSNEEFEKIHDETWKDYLNSVGI